ncbi:MAG TPA: Hsp20/alpha crystallin family protein [Casimicrobiaceae bacterium]|jgi:HSP20 family protein|nr:Hsp20/alpha crystallin family protein [Casimicrobiaceae bacterium]
MASLQIYDPFADPTVETLLRSFFRPERSERATPRSLPIDVAETENGYVVQAELAGVAKDEIHVAIEGNQVTIAAEVKRRGVDENARVLRNERYYGNVYRTFALPVELDEGGSEAKYENGLLTLTLVKKPAVAGRKLTVQ